MSDDPKGEQLVAAMARGRALADARRTAMSEAKRKHAWIRNAAFTNLTGFTKVCMECGLGLERGEKLVERVCPGKRITHAAAP